MPQRSVTVGSKVGLHARPAAVFVNAASQQPVSVSISKAGSDEPPVDASSILNVMTLDVGFGDEVVISADGAGAEAALDELAALLAEELDPG